MARNEAFHDGFGDGGGVVLVVDPEIAATRIISARLIAIGGKLNEGVMLANGDRFRGRSNLANPGTGLIACKGQSGFDFRVQWKIACTCQVDG